MSSSGHADRPPRGLLGGVGSAVAGAFSGARGWRAFAGPVAFLLAVTIAVIVFRSNGESASPGPAQSQVSQSKSPVKTQKRFYSVVAGDTLAGIATKTRVPLARIRALNPRVTPTALFIDQKIRLR